MSLRRIRSLSASSGFLVILLSVACGASPGGEGEPACQGEECAAMCPSQSCTLGESRCHAEGVVTCRADADGCGTWSAPEACTEGLVCFAGGECGEPPPVEYGHYWILGQLPAQTTAYLYAREAVEVTFSGTNTEPVTVELPGDEFTAYGLSDLGYVQEGTEWFYLQLDATGDVMVNFDRVVTLPVGEDEIGDLHGDSLHDKPPRALSTEHHFAFAQSGSADDIYVIYAPEPTTVTVTAHANDATTFTRELEVDGLFASTFVGDQFGHRPAGYGLHVTAEQPVAAGLFDELPAYPDPWDGSGYYFGRAGLPELFDEYMYIEQRDGGYTSLYSPSANQLSLVDESGASLADPIEVAGQTSLQLFHTSAGFTSEERPALIHLVGETPFAEYFNTPVATDVRDRAAFMGWNASIAQLQIHASEDTDVIVYDGRSRTILAELTVPAGGIYLRNLAALGFAEDEPFLAVIEASAPVYQQVQLPYYVRQYPGETGPIVE